MFNKNTLEVMYFDKDNVRRVTGVDVPIFQKNLNAAKEVALGGFFSEDDDVVIPPSRIIQIQINK